MGLRVQCPCVARFTRPSRLNPPRADPLADLCSASSPICSFCLHRLEKSPRRPRRSSAFRRWLPSSTSERARAGRGGVSALARCEATTNRQASLIPLSIQIHSKGQFITSAINPFSCCPRLPGRERQGRRMRVGRRAKPLSSASEPGQRAGTDGKTSGGRELQHE